MLTVGVITWRPSRLYRRLPGTHACMYDTAITRPASSRQVMARQRETTCIWRMDEKLNK
jgi:hypothetical protein